MKKKFWIQDAVKHKGSLHRNLGVKPGHKIPEDLLNAAAKRHDKVGAEARLAKTLQKLHRRKSAS